MFLFVTNVTHGIDINIEIQHISSTYVLMTLDSCRSPDLEARKKKEMALLFSALPRLISHSIPINISRVVCMSTKQLPPLLLVPTLAYKYMQSFPSEQSTTCLSIRTTLYPPGQPGLGYVPRGRTTTCMHTLLSYRALPVPAPIRSLPLNPFFFCLVFSLSSSCFVSIIFIFNGQVSISHRVSFFPYPSLPTRPETRSVYQTIYCMGQTTLYFWSLWVLSICFASLRFYVNAHPWV